MTVTAVRLSRSVRACPIEEGILAFLRVLRKLLWGFCLIKFKLHQVYWFRCDLTVGHFSGGVCQVKFSSRTFPARLLSRRS